MQRTKITRNGLSAGNCSAELATAICQIIHKVEKCSRIYCQFCQMVLYERFRCMCHVGHKNIIYFTQEFAPVPDKSRLLKVIEHIQCHVKDCTNKHLYSTIGHLVMHMAIRGCVTMIRTRQKHWPKKHLLMS